MRAAPVKSSRSYPSPSWIKQVSGGWPALHERQTVNRDVKLTQTEYTKLYVPPGVLCNNATGRLFPNWRCHNVMRCCAIGNAQRARAFTLSPGTISFPETQPWASRGKQGYYSRCIWVRIRCLRHIFQSVARWPTLRWLLPTRGVIKTGEMKKRRDLNGTALKRSGNRQ